MKSARKGTLKSINTSNVHKKEHIEQACTIILYKLKGYPQ